MRTAIVVAMLGSLGCGMGVIVALDGGRTQQCPPPDAGARPQVEAAGVVCCGPDGTCVLKNWPGATCDAGF